MNNLDKIDINLLKNVCVLNSEQKILKCFVFLKNKHNRLENIVPKKQILEYFPFLNAYLININQKDLKTLCDFEFVLYVSSVQKASILLYNSRKYLKVNDIHKLGFLGDGITCAVIDTGCYPHLDFCLGHNRIKKFVDFVDDKTKLYDDNGHGTFVCGVLAGNGLCFNGKYKGIAPNCDLVVLKALDKNGETQAVTILKSMQWILDNKEKYNIKVVCMSFGSSPIEKNDPLVEGAKILWENGICVVCAGGNDGPNHSSIKSPGVCPNVITVGSADKIDSLNEIKVAPFSSRGPAFDYIKPDIIAPGVDIVSTTNNKKFYTTMSGTSVSTPFVAGFCSLLLQKNTSFSPNHLKSILMANAQTLNGNQNDFGSGFVDLSNLFLNGD